MYDERAYHEGHEVRNNGNDSWQDGSERISFLWTVCDNQNQTRFFVLERKKYLHGQFDGFPENTRVREESTVGKYS